MKRIKWQDALARRNVALPQFFSNRTLTISANCTKASTSAYIRYMYFWECRA